MPDNHRFATRVTYYVCLTGGAVNGPRYEGELIEASELRNVTQLVEMRYVAPYSGQPIEHDGRLFADDQAVEDYDRLRAEEVVAEAAALEEAEAAAEAAEAAEAGEVVSEDDQPESIDDVVDRLGKIRPKADMVKAINKEFPDITVNEDDTVADTLDYVRLFLSEQKVEEAAEAEES